MEEQLKASAAEILAYIKAGTTFVVTQAPLVAQEYLRYCFWRDITILIALQLALIVAFLLWRKHKATTYDWADFPAYGFGAWVILVPSAIFTVDTIVDLLKIILAPRVYLFEALPYLH